MMMVGVQKVLEFSDQIQFKVLLDLGLSDKAATIDLRQLSLLINDEIIQSQVNKMMMVNIMMVITMMMVKMMMMI